MKLVPASLIFSTVKRASDKRNTIIKSVSSDQTPAIEEFGWPHL
jgi:hypothetical protein